MKNRLFSLLVVAFATINLFASKVITYTATSQLNGYGGSLSVGKTTFGSVIKSHTFSNGIGTITCSGEITTIGILAFYLCSDLTSVTIPNSVTTIEGNAFQGCSGLTSVTIPNSVTSIEAQAFYESGLTSVTIPNSVTLIGTYAFRGCDGLFSVTLNSNAICSKTYKSSSCIGDIFGFRVKEYIIGDSVTSIGTSAFEGCSRLTSITIGNSVISIGSQAFENCSGLTSVAIPNSVTTIGTSAFSGCSGLTSVTIPNSVTSIGAQAFYKSGLTSVTIPNSVTTIGAKAFYECSGLTSVTISNSVTTIEEQTFYDCGGLTSITIPNSVTSIGDYAFQGCRGSLSVTIPNSVTTIGDWAFRGCEKLTSVTIPNSVTSIGTSAFFGCAGLKKTNYTGTIADWCKIKFGDGTSNPMSWSRNFYINDVEVKDLVIPQSVDTISAYAFYDCSGLTSVTIPNSVTTIGTSAFYLCSGLTSVTIGNSVTTIGDWAFYECSGLTSVTIGNSVTTIGRSAFYLCRGLTSVTIPNSVTTIGRSAFHVCSALTSIVVDTANTHYASVDGVLFNYAKDTLIQYPVANSRTEYAIPNSVTTIEYNAFYGCRGLTLVTIGNSVTTIGEAAFEVCSGLTSITSYATRPPICGRFCFSYISTSIPVYVPAPFVDDYKQAKGWKDFENILPFGAVETPITTDDVIVAPQDNKVTFTWPQNNQAAGYSIEITKDGVVFCTLKFNAQGQLTGIAFAPSRDGGQAREMASAEMTASGWQFTVTGLSQGSRYNYTIDVLDASQQSLIQYTGEFTTTGGVPTGINGLTIDNAQSKVKKIIIGNQLYIRRDNEIYNAIGQKVK